MYDLCVIGAGCIGSAAARHASQWGRVCLIGPKEPEERLINDERDIFGAHYDEGRITRSSDEDFVWSKLGKESIARYRDLERSSGINFYNEVGYIICGTQNSEFMTTNIESAKQYGIKSRYLSSSELKKHFPYLNFSESDEAIYEMDNSGYISPRRLVDAQIQNARQNGCHMFFETVNEVKRCVQNGNYIMCVTTDSGRQIFAEKVLLATGAFTSFRDLLPNQLSLEVSLCPVTVAKVQISEAEYWKIRNMPSIYYTGTGAKDWRSKFKRSSDNIVRLFMLPPIKYPDGMYYIKLGHIWEDHPRILTTSEEVKDWFCSGGDDTIIRDIVDSIHDIVKGIQLLSHQGDCCVIVKTPSERPYIDHIHSQLGVALGGNGTAAKSSDEIGRIAAVMMMKNIWDSTLNKELFNIKFKNGSSKL